MIFRKPRILLLGDLFLDEWIHVTPRSLNPEGAAAIFSGDADERGMSLGGVGIAAVLAKKLEVSVKLMSRLSETSYGAIAHTILHRERLSCKHTTFVDDWAVPLKRRYINDAGVVVFRYDEELAPDKMLETAGEHFNAEKYEELAPKADCVLVLDYDKGYLSGRGPYIIEQAQAHDTPVLVGAKPHRLREYAGADLIKINAHEAAEFLDADYGDVLDNLAKAAESLCYSLKAKAAIITANSSGSACAVMTTQNVMMSFTAPAFACFPAVKNCVGAGDAFFAGFAVEYARARLEAGRTPSLSDMRSALVSAGAVAAAFLEGGPTAVTASVPVLARHELRCEDDPVSKIIELESLSSLCQAWKKNDESVVFTNGCFDLLHAGHMHLLEQARKQGSKLVVAINTDESIRALKGADRPVQPFDTRAKLLASLRYVDAVVALDEEDFIGNTALRSMVATVQPDVLVKGAEYAESEIVGWEEMVNREQPGRIWRCPMLSGSSTTNVIQRVKNSL